MIYLVQGVALICFGVPWLTAKVGRRRLAYIKRGTAEHTRTSRFAERIGFVGYVALSAGVFAAGLIHRIVAAI